MKSRDIFLLMFVCVNAECSASLQNISDISLSIKGFAKKYGYPLEVHNVTTEDGYILTMYRISHGRAGSEINSKPVLMMHAIATQSEIFIINAKRNGSLAFILADNNFDVWLGNQRGTRHGRKHKTLDSKYKEFWDFSIHEMGIYDLPAQIDYILGHTKKNKLQYIGYSQGAAVFYIMASSKPEYQEKILLASLIGPGGYEKNFNFSLLMPFVRAHKELTKFSELVNIFEIFPNGVSPGAIVTECVNEYLFRTLCMTVAKWISDDDFVVVDQEILVLFGKFMPSVSTNQLLHFAQMIDSGRFRPMIYGKKKNLKKYGEELPSDYNIKRIKVPVAVYYSIADNLAFAKDVEKICEDLPNCVRQFLMPNEKWNHLDFVFSTNISKELVDPMMDLMLSYD